jgi:hypothetical protein
MPDRSKCRRRTKCSLWCFSFGDGRGAKDITPEYFTVTKPWRRPRPRQGCSACKQEENIWRISYLMPNQKTFSKQQQITTSAQSPESLSLSFMLRPTVSRTVCLGINHPFGAYDQIFITCMTIAVFFSCGAPSLTRGRVWLLYMLLALASAIFLATIFYCLTFETSLFVASYDSQGHGGGIRSRLLQRGSVL